MNVTRLRQVVVAAHDRDAVERAFTQQLGLGAAFHDPGVAEFGLENAVCPVADVFVEVVAPKTDGSPGSGEQSAAGRHLKRHGESGYMVIFQVSDIAAARAHLDALGVRRVWNSDHPVIGASHAHPSDVGGAIVSFDEPRPAGSWLWGGPDWDARATSVATGFARIDIAAADPSALFRRWSEVLRVDGDSVSQTISLPDGVVVHFCEPTPAGGVGLVGVTFAGDRHSESSSVTIGGVRFTR